MGYVVTRHKKIRCSQEHCFALMKKQMYYTTMNQTSFRKTKEDLNIRGFKMLVNYVLSGL